jgi:N-acylneuraminate cytidylyltransferase/CMP-N,N'-diacetyllegionaminic acid synthase
MYQGKTFLVVIPARGGSKGLPGKNIKDLNGKPLIAWSIDAAFESKYLDEIMVTTDSEDIAYIASEYSASVPFLRPHYLASDTTTTFDTVKHTIDFYRNKLKRVFDYIVLLEPTSPLRTSSDIDRAIEQLLSSSATSIVGICRTESQNPAFLVNKDKDNFIFGYKDKDMEVKRRQDIKDVYFFEGSIYISRIKDYLNNTTFYHKDTIGHEFPKYKSLEVDDIYDFIMIEAIMVNNGY